MSRLAKWKTAIQMGALTLMILGDKALGVQYVDEVGRLGLSIAALLTLITGYAYLRKGFKHL